MSAVPVINLTEPHPSKLLVTIRAYIDLLAQSKSLTPCDGLKRLYVLSAGLETLNTEDTVAVVRKAQKSGMLKEGMHSFLTQSIVRNCYLYARILEDVAVGTLERIANGDLVNPPSRVSNNGDKARRLFYLPPITLITRLKQAVDRDYSVWFADENSPVPAISDVAQEAMMLLQQMDRQAGNISPNQAAYSALYATFTRAVTLMEDLSGYPEPPLWAREKARDLLKVLWVITKLLLGDLAVQPKSEELNQVDLESHLAVSDATLAAIPYPTKMSVHTFAHREGDAPVQGLSFKGRAYLAAASACRGYLEPVRHF